MSCKSLSPAAQLLRHSRLMAMPARLPPPQTASINQPPASPYPTQQAITTPQSSAFRGNWGLKRDLPLATSAKTTYMRYNDLDTIEHMTTFESAHDDVYTLRKWQELDMALSAGQNLRMYGKEVYHFNDNQAVFDGTEGTQPEAYKWRYAGKFVDGLAGKDLEEFIQEVLPRKEEFYTFVKKRQNIDKLRTQYADRGIQVNEAQLQEEASKMPEKEVDLLALRANRPYLEKLVKDFLDIPTSKPFATHPSAGLYYTRSNAHVHYDSELIPQERPKEVPGRHLNHMVAAGGPVVGIGGVVAKVNQVYGRSSAGDRFKVNKYRPVRATIDNRGKILLEVDQSVEPQDFSMSNYGQPGRSHFGDEYIRRRVVKAQDAQVRRRAPQSVASFDHIIDMIKSKR